MDDLTPAAAGSETMARFCARGLRESLRAAPLGFGPGAEGSAELVERHKGAFSATGCEQRRPLLMVDPPVGSVRTTAGIVRSPVWRKDPLLLSQICSRSEQSARGGDSSGHDVRSSVQDTGDVTCSDGEQIHARPAQQPPGNV
ncbi:hypothetical protein ILYODFUR_028712 [Ilyodon furcidens]|uniref:Uncharacterized protein n=1 Tax=Ilyodon furcidens TaxID=33524 RepID=A0ABV0VJI0_9TELE